MTVMVMRTLNLNRGDAEKVVEAIRLAREGKSGSEAVEWLLLLSKAIAVLDRIADGEAALTRKEVSR